MDTKRLLIKTGVLIHAGSHSFMTSVLSLKKTDFIPKWLHNSKFTCRF